MVVRVCRKLESMSQGGPGAEGCSSAWLNSEVGAGNFERCPLMKVTGDPARGQDESWFVPELVPVQRKESREPLLET